VPAAVRSVRALLAGCLATLLISAAPASATGGPPPSVRIFIDEAPTSAMTAVVLDGILYFPLRALTSALRATLVFARPDLEVRRADGQTFMLRVGRREVWDGGQVTALAEAPVLLVSGVTMAPRGSVESIFDALVVWTPGESTATIVTQSAFHPAPPVPAPPRPVSAASVTAATNTFVPDFTPVTDRPLVASGTVGFALAAGRAGLSVSSRLAFVARGDNGTISGAVGIGTANNAPAGAAGMFTWRRATSTLSAGVLSMYDSPLTLYEQGLVGLIYDQRFGRIETRFFGGVLPGSGGTVYGMSLRLPQIGALVPEATFLYSPETNATITRARVDWRVRPGFTLFGEAAYGTSSLGSGVGWRLGAQYSSERWSVSLSYLALSPGFPTLGNASVFAGRHGPVLEFVYRPSSRFFVLASAALLTGATDAQRRLAYRLYMQYQISPVLALVGEARSTDEPVGGVRMRRDTAQAALLYTSGRWNAALTVGAGVDEEAGRLTANSRSISLRAGYTLANGWPVWSELTWLMGNNQALALGAGTRIRLNERFDLTAQVRAKTILGGTPSTETALELGVSHALASGGRLTVGAGVKVTSSPQTSSAAAPYVTIGYTRPFSIFGPLKVGRVAADVFIDKNGNGRRDADETGVPGVTIRIDDRSASRTDAGGRSTIDGVREGEYRVSVDQATIPVGFVTLQPEVRARVTADAKTPVAFALTPGAALQCLVYLDENGNGVRDTSEQGVADVGATLQPLGRVTATDLDGVLLFRDLKPGTYTLTLDGRVLPSNVKLAGVTSYTVALAAGAAAACELPVVNGKKIVVTFP
jgi:uncharacterized protein (DUF2141 family)